MLSCLQSRRIALALEKAELDMDTGRMIPADSKYPNPAICVDCGNVANPPYGDIAAPRCRSCLLIKWPNSTYEDTPLPMSSCDDCGKKVRMNRLKRFGAKVMSGGRWLCDDCAGRRYVLDGEQESRKAQKIFDEHG